MKSLQQGWFRRSNSDTHNSHHRPLRARPTAHRTVRSKALLLVHGNNCVVCCVLCTVEEAQTKGEEDFGSSAWITAFSRSTSATDPGYLWRLYYPWLPMPTPSNVVFHGCPAFALCSFYFEQHIEPKTVWFKSL